MSLISQIQTIITAIAPGATSILSSKFNANYQSFNFDSSDLPLIILNNEIPNTSEIKKNNNVIKDVRILITFLVLDSTDNSDSESQALTDSMEALADLVAVRVYQELEVRPVGNQKYKITPMYRVFNTMLTGVALDMQINYNSIINFE
jgi:hypothetical protein